MHYLYLPSPVHRKIEKKTTTHNPFSLSSSFLFLRFINQSLRSPSVLVLLTFVFFSSFFCFVCLLRFLSSLFSHCFPSMFSCSCFCVSLIKLFIAWFNWNHWEVAFFFLTVLLYSINPLKVLVVSVQLNQHNYNCNFTIWITFYVASREETFIRDKNHPSRALFQEKLNKK